MSTVMNSPVCVFVCRDYTNRDPTVLCCGGGGGGGESHQPRELLSQIYMVNGRSLVFLVHLSYPPHQTASLRFLRLQQPDLMLTKHSYNQPSAFLLPPAAAEHTHTLSCTSGRTHMRTHTHTHIHTHTHTHKNRHSHRHTYRHMSIHTDACTLTHMQRYILNTH